MLDIKDVEPGDLVDVTLEDGTKVTNSPVTGVSAPGQYYDLLWVAADTIALHPVRHGRRTTRTRTRRRSSSRLPGTGCHRRSTWSRSYVSTKVARSPFPTATR